MTLKYDVSQYGQSWCLKKHQSPKKGPTFLGSKLQIVKPSSLMRDFRANKIPICTKSKRNNLLSEERSRILWRFLPHHEYYGYSWWGRNSIILLSSLCQLLFATICFKLQHYAWIFRQTFLTFPNLPRILVPRILIFFGLWSKVELDEVEMKNYNLRGVVIFLFF